MSKEISVLQYEDVRKQIGHYKKMDYHPEIRPAGIVDLAEGIDDCFKDYKLQDAVEALQPAQLTSIRHDKNEIFRYSPETYTANTSICTGVKSCLEMGKLTPFQSLIAELKNTAMNSYWKKEAGKISDRYNLPRNMEPVLTTFGKSTKSNGKAGELINPLKTAAEVIVESHKGHALYKKSHNDYYPMEQVKREYTEPFNSRYKYGKKTKSDKMGGRVKRSMMWFNQDVASIVSNIQADLREHTQTRLGRAVFRADIVSLLEGRTFGKVNERGSYCAGESLRYSPPNNDKTIQKQYLEHINMLRLSLKKRAFPFTDLYQTFVYHDKNKMKSMKMEEIYCILGMFEIHPNRQIFESLLNTLNLINNDTVSYKDITDLLSWKCEFPLLPKINDIPLEHQNYYSTYKETICNGLVKKETYYTTGLGTERMDVPYAVVPRGRPHCDRESLGDQTSVAAILSPNIFTQYGLSHMDFFKIRSAHDMRILFEDIGVDFPGDSFSVLWNAGLKKDCTGGVCIETFRGLLDQLAAATYEKIPVA